MDQANLIVPEKLLRLARSKALRLGAVAAILPFIGVVAAFGIAPDTVTERVTVQSVIEQVALPVAPAGDTTEEAYTREERVQRGDTIASVLARLRVEDQSAIRFMRNSVEARALRS